MITGSVYKTETLYDEKDSIELGIRLKKLNEIGIGNQVSYNKWRELKLDYKDYINCNIKGDVLNITNESSSDVLVRNKMIKIKATKQKGKISLWLFSEDGSIIDYNEPISEEKLLNILDNIETVKSQKEYHLIRTRGIEEGYEETFKCYGGNYVYIMDIQGQNLLCVHNERCDTTEELIIKNCKEYIDEVALKKSYEIGVQELNSGKNKAKVNTIYVDTSTGYLLIYIGENKGKSIFYNIERVIILLIGKEKVCDIDKETYRKSFYNYILTVDDKSISKIVGVDFGEQINENILNLLMSAKVGVSGVLKKVLWDTNYKIELINLIMDEFKYIGKMYKKALESIQNMLETKKGLEIDEDLLNYSLTYVSGMVVSKTISGVETTKEINQTISISSLFNWITLRIDKLGLNFDADNIKGISKDTINFIRINYNRDEKNDNMRLEKSYMQDEKVAEKIIYNLNNNVFNYDILQGNIGQLTVLYYETN